MRFSGAAGLSRTSAAVLRRRRGVTSASSSISCSRLALCTLFRAYGTSSVLRVLAASAASTVAVAAPSPSPRGQAFYALRTARRFEVSSSELAAAGTPPAVSTTTKLRHRRGAHRKRGGGADTAGANSSPSLANVTLAEDDVAGAAAVDATAPAAVAVVGEGSKTEKKKVMRRDMSAADGVDAAATQATKPPEAKTVTGEVTSPAGGAADAIMMELAASNNPGRVNRHTTTQTPSPEKSSNNDSSPNNAAAATSSKTAASQGGAKEADEDDSEVVDVQPKRHRRNSRTRGSKGRHSSQDGSADAAHSSTASAAEATTVDSQVSPPAAKVKDVKKSPTLSDPLKTTTTATLEGSADNEGDGVSLNTAAAADETSLLHATSPKRKNKMKRGRRSIRAPPMQEAAVSSAEGINQDAAAPPIDAETEVVIMAEAEERNAAEDVDASAAAATRSPSPPSLVDTTAPRPSPGRRPRRGKRGRASLPAESSFPAVTGAAAAAAAEIHQGGGGGDALLENHGQAANAAAAAAMVKEKVGKATGTAADAASSSSPTSERSTRRGKRAAAVSETEVDAAVTVALHDASPPPSTTTNVAEAPTATDAIPAVTTTAADESKTTRIDDDAAGAGSSAKAKKRRGRRRSSNSVYTAATPAANAEVAGIDGTVRAASDAASNSVVTTPTTPPATEVDVNLPKSTAAALKKLLATGMPGRGSGDGDAGGVVSSLAAKKRLAAQIIRRRWQLQQASKANRAAPAAATTTLTTMVVAEQPVPLRRPQQEKDGEVAAAAQLSPSTLAAATKADASTAAEGSDKPRRKEKRRNSPKPRRVTAAIISSAAAEPVETVPSGEEGASLVETVEAASVASAASTTAEAETVTSQALVVDVEATEGEEAARDADVAAAIKAAIAMAAAQGSDASPSFDNDGFPAAVDGVAGAVPRSLATLVARSQNVVTSAAARAGAAASTAKSAKGGSSGSGSGDEGGSSPSSGSSGGGGGGGAKGANARDTLYFPDYRERVVQIFEQMAEINSALGERYKALSYSNTVERLKRGDMVFQLLPPNLLPLPEDSPKWKAPPADAAGATDAVTVAAQRRAKEVEENRAKRLNVLSADNRIPGVGQKLRVKIVEILKTGDLAELHRLEARPLIRAIRELTQVHGFGPRTAIEFFKKYNITTVKELQDYAVKKGELDMGNKATGKPAGLTHSTSNAHRAGFHLSDAQRLGLVYHKDMSRRIPHDEGRLHEAFMKLRLRKYLGKDYELVVCGSYRRQVAASGDIDVLITRKRMGDGGAPSSSSSTTAAPLPPHEVLATFLNGLKTDRYIEATLAQGPTKFMGLCRLRALHPPSGTTLSAPPPRFRARRLDVRYVDASCFPAAMLYFTGSKNFNVIMRSEAIKKRCVLNEYGLFRKFSRKQQLQRQAAGEKPYNLHEMITQVARFGFASMAEILQGNGSPDNAASEEAEESSASSSALTSARKKVKKKSKEKTKEEIAELCEVAKIVEQQRVKAMTEKEIFDALDMDYVQPKDRNV
jgi:DNA polymerase beta